LKRRIQLAVLRATVPLSTVDLGERLFREMAITRASD